MKFLLLSFFFSCLTLYCFAQPIVSITIFSEAGKVPLQDIYVTTASGFAATTNENGFANLKNLPKGTSTLAISGIGYEPVSVSLASLVGLKGNAVVYLKTKITALADVVVKASAAGGVFKTISDFDIHLRPIVNSQEVLRLVPGLFIGQHAGGGKAEQLFLRGFDIDHGTDINITVDGVPVNMVSHAHGQGYADLHFLIPELIDKVSFNKGPYTTDKGNLATAGSVAFQTKNYLENSFIKLEGGQFNTGRFITGINLLKPQFDKQNQSLFFAGEASFTKGYFESSQNFYRYNGLLKYHGKVGANATLNASLSGFSSKWNASGQIPDRAVEDGTVGFYGAIDNTEGGKTSRYNANVELVNNLSSNAALRNRIFYTKYKFELYSNFTFFKEDPINGDQIRQKEDRDILGYTTAYQLKHQAQGIDAEFTIGAQLRYDRVNNIELSRTKNRNIVTNPIQLGDVNEFNGGIYLQEKYILTPRLDATVGIRGDYFTNKYADKLLGGSAASNSFIVSPKLNLNYRINNHVQLYWSNGKGFHSNDTRVAVAQNGKEVVTPALGSDIGGVFRLGKNVVLQTAFWYLYLKQEFIYVGDEGVVEPSGKSRRYGWDASIRYQLTQNLYADVDVNLANPRALNVPTAESYLPLAPRFSSTGGLSYRKEKGWNGSLRYRFLSKRPANEDYSVTAKGYFVTDAAINYTTKKWDAGLAIQNVLNVKWKETQFDTESRLQAEPAPVSEIHFTPGSPFFARLSFTLFF